MGNKHTPGPWFVTYGGSGTMYVASKAASIGYQTIVEMHSKPACAELDARLIAAAPELLEALKLLKSEVIRLHGGYAGQALEGATAAIAKAEGNEGESK